MSTFKAVCPHCSHEYELNIALLGKKGKCSNCRERFVLNPVELDHAGKENKTNDSKVGESKSDFREEGTSSYIAPEKFSDVFSQEYWLPGTLILGMYEVRELMPGVLTAQGGAGIVQRVYHREWDMDLAVKSPKQGVLLSEAGIAHYERECQTWLELGLHPNIVTCYLIRRIDNIPRIFAEFVQDGSLRDWMIDRRLYEGGAKRALLRILDIAIQSAWGLDYAHRQNLLHLDIKPANVMMSAGIPKIADFGLAQAISRRKQTEQQDSEAEDQTDGEETKTSSRGTLKWEGMTPAYCSPEQFQASILFQQGIKNSGTKLTRQSDIWSWALTVFAMFCSQAPCKKGGHTAGKVLEMYLKMPVPQNRVSIPPDVAEVLRHCFQEKPADRPRSLSDVAKRLVEIYEKESGVPYKWQEPRTTNWTAESVNNRALSLLDLNKPQDADLLFQEALKIQPWEPTVTYNKTLLQWRQGKCTDMEGLRCLETLVKTRPQAVSYFGLGLFQRERGNIPSALEALNTAWELGQRPEIKRAVHATVELRSQNVKYTERLTVRPFSLGIMMPGLAFWHSSEKRLLLPLETCDFVLVDPQTGRTNITFKSSQEVFQGKEILKHDQRIALSDDFQWELFAGEQPGTLRVQHAGEPQNQFILEPAAWGDLKKTIVVPYVVADYGVDKYAKIFPDSERPQKIELRFQLQNYKVEVLEVKHVQKICELIGHEADVQSVTIHKSGRWIATGGKDETIRLWELPTGRCIRTFENVGRSVDALSFSQSGEYLLSLSEKKHLRIWKIGLLTRHAELLHGPVQIAQISSSEEVTRLQNEMSDLQKTVEQTIEQKDFEQTLLGIQRMQRLPGWESARNQLPWEQLICHCFRDRLADAIGPVTLSGHVGQISSVVLSLDGKLGISAGQDQTIRLWNTENQQCLRVLEGHQDWIHSLSLSLDSRYLLSGSWDTTAKIWNVGTGKCVLEYPEKIRSLSHVRFHPSAKLALIANTSGTVLSWNVLENRLLGQWTLHQGGINSLTFNRDGRYFLSAGDDATIRLCKTDSGRVLHSWTPGKSPIVSARFSPEGHQLYWANKEGTIEVWNLLQNCKERSFGGHLAELLSMELFLDGRFLLTTSKDKTIKVWNVQDGSLQQTLSGHSAAVRSVATNASGLQLFSGAEDGLLCVWNLFWDFSLPKDDWDPRATPMLHALLSTFCEGNNAAAPSLNQGLLEKILLEMGYRNFGWIAADRLRQEIAQILEQWNGPISLEPSVSFSGRRF